MVQDELKNKVALITGANKGLGLEMSRQLGQHGLTILIASRSLDAAKTAASNLENEGVIAHPIALDITDSTQIEFAVQQISDSFGRLDVLINNAGVFLDGDWLTSNPVFLTSFPALMEQRSGAEGIELGTLNSPTSEPAPLHPCTPAQAQALKGVVRNPG